MNLPHPMYFLIHNRYLVLMKTLFIFIDTHEHKFQAGLVFILSTFLPESSLLPKNCKEDFLTIVSCCYVFSVVVMYSVLLLLCFGSLKAFTALLENDTEWDRLNALKTDYNSFEFQLALLAKLESQKLEQYKDIFCDVLIPFSDIEIVEDIGEGME